MSYNAGKIIINIGDRLRTLVGLTSKWAVHDAKRIPHSYINDDDNPVYSGMVHLLFKKNEMQFFFDNLDKIEALQQRDLKIERLRSESADFDELMKMIDFTLEMSE